MKGRKEGEAGEAKGRWEQGETKRRGVEGAKRREKKEDREKNLI